MPDCVHQKGWAGHVLSLSTLRLVARRSPRSWMSGTAWPLSPRAQPAAKNHPEGQPGGPRTASADRSLNQPPITTPRTASPPTVPLRATREEMQSVYTGGDREPHCRRLFACGRGQAAVSPSSIHRSCSDLVLCSCPLPRPSITYIPAASRIANRFFPRPLGFKRKAEGYFVNHGLLLIGPFRGSVAEWSHPR
jgi:hypothetical protein